MRESLIQNWLAEWKRSEYWLWLRFIDSNSDLPDERDLNLWLDGKMLSHWVWSTEWKRNEFWYWQKYSLLQTVLKRENWFLVQNWFKEWSFEWERNESQSWSKRFIDSKIVLLGKRSADPKPDSLNGMGVNLCSNEIRKSNQNDRKNWVTQGVQRRIDIQPSFLFFLKCGKKFHEISLKFPKISVIRNEQALELCFCQTTL